MKSKGLKLAGFVAALSASCLDPGVNIEIISGMKAGHYVFPCSSFQDRNGNRIIDGPHEIVGLNRLSYRLGEQVSFGCRSIGKVGRNLTCRIRGPDGSTASLNFKVIAFDEYDHATFTPGKVGEYDGLWYSNEDYVGGNRVSVR